MKNGAQLITVWVIVYYSYCYQLKNHENGFISIIGKVQVYPIYSNVAGERNIMHVGP